MKKFATNTLATLALTGALSALAATFNELPPSQPQEKNDNIIEVDGKHYDINKTHEVKISTQFGNAVIDGAIRFTANVDALKKNNLSDEDFAKIATETIQKEIEKAKNEKATTCYNDLAFVQEFEASLFHSYDVVASNYHVDIINLDDGNLNFSGRFVENANCKPNDVPIQQEDIPENNPEQVKPYWYKKPMLEA